MQKKHFLDTSILLPLFFGSEGFSAYLESKFGSDAKYISSYVKMEFKRSHLSNILDFYFVLSLPNIINVADAISLWSNKFKKSELKAVLHLISQLLKTQGFQFNRSQDKQKALMSIGLYVKRIIAILNGKFKDIGIDSTHCTRNEIPFNIRADKLMSDLYSYYEQFNDLDYCRNNCKIDHFILKKYKSDVQVLVQEAQNLPSNNATLGYRKICENLEDILDKGPSKCSCKMCERIGDAVIAIDTPEDMQIEHIDNSFDYLCRALGKSNRKHSSESSYFKNNQKSLFQ